jgi:hypothetical protein
MAMISRISASRRLEEAGHAANGGGFMGDRKSQDHRARVCCPMRLAIGKPIVR